MIFVRTPRRGLVFRAHAQEPNSPRPVDPARYRVYLSPCGGFELYLDEAVLGRFLHQAKRFAPNECIGMLLGVRGEDARGRHATVLAAVLDTMAKASPVSVETSTESEAATHSIASEQFPDLLPVGWVHSHPRLGVFFSGTDRRTQTLWGKDGIGLVVDPWGTPQEAVFHGPSSEQLEFRGTPEHKPTPTEDQAPASAPRRPLRLSTSAVVRTGRNTLALSVSRRPPRHWHLGVAIAIAGVLALLAVQAARLPREAATAAPIDLATAADSSVPSPPEPAVSEETPLCGP